MAGGMEYWDEEICGGDYCLKDCLHCPKRCEVEEKWAKEQEDD